MSPWLPIRDIFRRRNWNRMRHCWRRRCRQWKKFDPIMRDWRSCASVFRCWWRWRFWSHHCLVRRRRGRRVLRALESPIAERLIWARLFLMCPCCVCFVFDVLVRVMFVSIDNIYINERTRDLQMNRTCTVIQIIIIKTYLPTSTALEDLRISLTVIVAITLS